MRVSYGSFLLILVVIIASCKEDDTMLPTDSSVIGPIVVDDIYSGYWQDINHVQGICFSGNSMFISCSRQLIEYDPSLNEVINERLCSNLPGDFCTHYHFGDPACYDQDLWVTYHEGSWESEYSCSKNQILKFENAAINESFGATVYNLDYKGHVGAIEIINETVYVSGKYIAPDWSADEICNETLLIYTYDINLLQDTSIASCNMHTGEIFIEQKGQNGVQVLSKRDDQNLLVAPYRCNVDSLPYVYNVDISNDSYNVSLFKEKNWAYGVAIDSDSRIFYSEDNRGTSAFSIFENLE